MVKHGGRGVMVWGAFSAAGTGELLHCEKSMNALEYRRIWQRGLLPTIEKLFSIEEYSDVIFQQDSAPSYPVPPKTYQFCQLLMPKFLIWLSLKQK